MRNLAVYAPGLPDAPIDAAREFHGGPVETVRSAVAAARGKAPDGPEGLLTVTVVFPSADHRHHAWRLAAIQALARESAPVRVNGLVGDDESAIGAVLDYLTDAPGVTGQLLSVGARGLDES